MAAQKSYFSILSVSITIILVYLHYTETISAEIVTFGGETVCLYVLCRCVCMSCMDTFHGTLTVSKREPADTLTSHSAHVYFSVNDSRLYLSNIRCLPRCPPPLSVSMSVCLCLCLCLCLAPVSRACVSRLCLAPVSRACVSRLCLAPVSRACVCLSLSLIRSTMSPS
jgi:hypothetical protein